MPHRVIYFSERDNEQSFTFWAQVRAHLPVHGAFICYWRVVSNMRLVSGDAYSAVYISIHLQVTENLDVTGSSSKPLFGEYNWKFNGIYFTKLVRWWDVNNMRWEERYPSIVQYKTLLPKYGLY